MMKKKFIERIHLSLDVMIVAGSFVLAYAIKKFVIPGSFGGLSSVPNYYILLAQIITSWIIADMMFNPYEFFHKKRIFTIITDNLKMLLVVTVLLIVSSFMFKIETSRIMMGIFFILSFGFLLINKCVIMAIYKNHFKKEINRINVIIVGTRGRARQVIEHIHAKNSTYRIIGCLDTTDLLNGTEVKNGVRVIGSLENLKEIVIENIVDEVIFAMPLEKIDSVDIYILLLEMLGISVRIFPDWYIHSTVFQPGISQVSFDSFDGSPTMVLTGTSQNHLCLMLKSTMDISAAFFMLVLASPFFIITGAMIKLFSKGPVFFRQQRIGLNGRRFTLYKFRTMVVDAEKRLEELKKQNEADGPAFKMTNDPRIIPYIGTFLRKTSMDELPQLINVLCGEMSLVGPRPPIPTEVQEYNLWQRRRFSMKPGLTCLWQIKPNRNDISFNEWISLDLNYIDNWSLKLDFSILARTALVVFAGYGR